VTEYTPFAPALKAELRWQEVLRLSEYLAVVEALTVPTRWKAVLGVNEYVPFPPDVALALAGLRVRECIVPFPLPAALAGPVCGVYLNVRGCNCINGMAPEPRLSRQGKNIFSFSFSDEQSFS